MEDFSVAIIARNEEKTLPRLLESIKGVEDIVVVDTGSTDDTVKIAKEFGCRVFEVGDKFIERPTREDVELFESRYGFKPSFTEESKLFNYGAARNYAASLTKNEFVFCPDADEIVTWDLDKVRELLPDCDQLEYRFCYIHDEYGKCALEFTHCKFFRKGMAQWFKKVHEVILGLEQARVTYTDDIYLDHWQGVHPMNKNYLQKLEYGALEDEKDDRNIYYLGREYYLLGDSKIAIKMLNIALENMYWKAERGQAYIFIGNCYQNLGMTNEAIIAYHKSLIEYDKRREPFWVLGLFLARIGRRTSAIAYLEAALTIPYNNKSYLNETDLYSWKIHDYLAYLYINVDKEKMAYHWLEAVKARPYDDKILNKAKTYWREDL